MKRSALVVGLPALLGSILVVGCYSSEMVAPQPGMLTDAAADPVGTPDPFLDPVPPDPLPDPITPDPLPDPIPDPIPDASEDGWPDADLPIGASILDCAYSAGYEFFHWENDITHTPEMHIFGIYESRSDHGGGYHPRGEATVYVSTRTPVVIGLSSYEPTHWTVIVKSGTRIEEILVNGYHEQTATVPEGITVRFFDHEVRRNGLPTGHGSDGGGGDTWGLILGMEGLAGIPYTSFSGCYRATQFSLSN